MLRLRMGDGRGFFAQIRLRPTLWDNDALLSHLTFSWNARGAHGATRTHCSFQRLPSSRRGVAISHRKDMPGSLVVTLACAPCKHDRPSVTANDDS